MRLRATKSFYNNNRNVSEGEAFVEPSERRAQKLIAAGLACECFHIVPVAVPSEEPEPPALATLRAWVLAASNAIAAPGRH